MCIHVVIHGVLWDPNVGMSRFHSDISCAPMPPSDSGSAPCRGAVCRADWACCRPLGMFTTTNARTTYIACGAQLADETGNMLRDGCGHEPWRVDSVTHRRCSVRSGDGVYTCHCEILRSLRHHPGASSNYSVAATLLRIGCAQVDEASDATRRSSKNRWMTWTRTCTCEEVGVGVDQGAAFVSFANLPSEDAHFVIQEV